MAARTALSAVPPSRTPERQRLADAIAERDRRSGLLEAKRQELAATLAGRKAIWSRRSELEEALEAAAAPATEAERTAALLRGEMAPADPRPAIQAELAELAERMVRLKSEAARLENDEELLRAVLRVAETDVRQCRDAVLRVDPATAATVAAYHAAKTRFRVLERAIEHTLNILDPVSGPTLAGVTADPEVARPLPPCPWRTAADRLLTDPDVPLPDPAAV